MGYALGSLVTVKATFRVENVQTDPTTVKLIVRDPSGESTAYTYGVDAVISRLREGRYAADIDANAAGQWYYRWIGSGDVQAAIERAFTVDEAHAVEEA